MTSFFVAGEPVPKGSTRSFYKGGKVITTNANRRTKDWEMRIATEAQALNLSPTDEPVVIELLFSLPRPKSLRKKTILHTKRPDLDKLVRAGLDALTNVLFLDDSQVYKLTAEKQYALAGEKIGARITLRMGVLDG